MLADEKHVGSERVSEATTISRDVTTPVDKVKSEAMMIVNEDDDYEYKAVVPMLGLRLGSLLRTWTQVSKINYMSCYPLDMIAPGHNSIRRRSIGIQSKDYSMQMFVPHELRDQGDEALFNEQFPVSLTSLMNEDQLWGCFYTFPELYADVYSPTVRMRSAEDVTEPIGGVLNIDMVSACLTYLKRTPILGDYVYIKLDISFKMLTNIDVLQRFKYLVYLDMSSNYLTDINILSNLLYLQYLAVDSNRLSTVLGYDTPQWFLTEVHYKFNYVKHIRDLSMFWSITILNLAHNNIKAISGLQNMRFLRRLDLSFNHIQRLENLNYLRLLWLDVSYNNISSFEFSEVAGLWTLAHLEYLNVNENNLTTMKIFCGCSRLRELHARNNRLSTLLELAVYMREMRRLIVLDLRANPLCNLQGYNDVIIYTFPVLLTLDAEEIDPIVQRTMQMDLNPDVRTFAAHRLLRLLYVQQLSRARVPTAIPPADTTQVPIVVVVGYDAVGKGALCRRLAKECSSHVSLGIQHTTAFCHGPGHYHEVTRSNFDDMILAGELLTYCEINGQSYGLSRNEAAITEGKVKIVAMDLAGALMLRFRGRRPYVILATCLNKEAQTIREQQRKIDKIQALELRQSLDTPLFGRSVLQTMVSGRIIITGIINEIIMKLPEKCYRAKFVIDSQCSLEVSSEQIPHHTRKDQERGDKGFNIMNMLTCSSSDLGVGRQHLQISPTESLYSLYKKSVETDENSCGPGQLPVQGCFQDESYKNKVTSPAAISCTSRPKSVEFASMNWKNSPAGPDTKASRTVAFNSSDVSGCMVDPPIRQSQNKEDRSEDKLPLSISEKFPFKYPEHSESDSLRDDEDLWMAFLVEAGLAQNSTTRTSSVNVKQSLYSKTSKVSKTSRVDPDTILKLLNMTSTNKPISYENVTTKVKDDYETLHRNCPGLFWDTINMDNPNKAFKKMKRIIKDIVESQEKLKPMFQIDFANMKHYTTVQKRLQNICNEIAPQRLFY